MLMSSPFNVSRRMHMRSAAEITCYWVVCCPSSVASALRSSSSHHKGLGCPLEDGQAETSDGKEHYSLLCEQMRLPAVFSGSNMCENFFVGMGKLGEIFSRLLPYSFIQILVMVSLFR